MASTSHQRRAVVGAGGFPLCRQALAEHKDSERTVGARSDPQGVSPELQAQVQQGANMQAVQQLTNTMQGGNMGAGR